MPRSGIPWRFLAASAAVLVALAIAAWLAVRWALEAPMVAERGAERAIAAIPGLSVEGIQGSLATGLSAARVVYESADLRVVATDVRAAWKRDAALASIRESLASRAGGRPLLTLDSLTVATVEIATRGDRDQPRTVPTDLDLPIRFDIASIRIGSIAHSDAQSRWEVRELDGRASSDGSRHRIELARLVHDDATLGAQVAIAAAPPFELSGTLEARGEASEFGLEISTRIAGTLEFPRLSGQLQAARGAAEGSGDFEVVGSPFAELPLSSLRLSTRRLDLRRWNREWPTTALTADIDATMTSERSLSGQLRVVNALPGSLDASRVPLRELSGRFTFAPDAFTLDGARARTTSGGELRGGGRFAGGKGELRLTTPALVLTDLDRRIRPLTVSGSAAARLEGEVLRLSADIRHRDYALVGEATRQGTRIDVARASLASPYGKADFSGDLDLAGGRPFRARGRLAGFNPADFGSFPQARLSGDFVARGTLEPEFAAQVEVRLAESTLRGQPLSGTVDAHITGQRRFAGTLDLRYAGNRMTASGGFGQPGDRLQWSVDAPELARIDPRAAGALAASGVLGGTVAEPELAFAIDARSLGWSEAPGPAPRAAAGAARVGSAPGRTAAGELHAAGRIELRRGGAFEVQARARDLVAFERKIGSLAIATDGTVDAHRLRADATVDEGAVSVRASGGWDAAAGWRGTLEQASSQRPALTLERPAPLEVAADRVRFGPARLLVEGGQVELQQLAWGGGALSVSARFDDLPLARVLQATGRQGAITTDLRLAGRIELDLGPDLRGSLALTRQSGDLAFSDEAGLTAGLSRLSISVQAPGGGDVVATVDAEGERIGSVDAVLRTRLRRGEGGWSLGSGSPLEGRVDADVRRLSWINTLLPGDFRLRGRARAQIRAAGSLGSPQLSGSVEGERLGLRSLQTGLELSEGVLQARLEGSAITIERLEAKGPSGTLRASGRLAADPEGKAVGRIEVVADALRAVSRPDRVVVVSGTGTIAVDGPKVIASGAFVADEGRIDLPPAEKPQLSADVVVLHAEATPVASTRGPGVVPELDVEFDLGKDFVLRGRGLDTRLTGKIRFGRANGAITARGSVRTEGGTYLAYGRRLEIERGIVTFTGALDNPTLDIRALRTRQQVEAGVLVTGALAAPRIQLISRPDVPDTEKLSWLVLGQGLDKSSRAQGALLQSAALALLSPGGGGGLQNRIAQLFGFDQVSFTSGDSLQSGVVTIGKQLTRDLYVSVEQGLAGANSFVQVNFLLGRKWTLSARSGGQENALDVYYTLRFD